MAATIHHPAVKNARPPRAAADWLTEKLVEAYCYAAARIARPLP